MEGCQCSPPWLVVRIPDLRALLKCRAVQVRGAEPLLTGTGASEKEEWECRSQRLVGAKLWEEDILGHIQGRATFPRM